MRHLLFTRCAVVAVLASCGGSRGSAAPPAATSPSTELVIPEVTEEQSKQGEKESAPPAGERPAIAAGAEEAPAGEGSDAPPDIWGSPSWSSAPRGGPDCDRAADCCLKFSLQTGADPSIQRVCNNIRTAPTSVCNTMLTSFQQAASSASVQCP